MKDTLVLDIETYSNYFLVQFKHVERGTVRYYEMFDGQALDIKSVAAILRQYRIVTFNGMNYDMPILFLALTGATNADLKRASDHIIVGNLRGWQFEKEYNIRIPSWLDHIDLMEAVPGVGVSLKLYGGRLHSKKLQDLPFDPARLISEADRALLREYCENDLDTTIDLWKKATDPKDNIIETRERLTAESGVDVRSKSDAQIAEAIIRKRVETALGDRIYKSEIRPGTTYKYNAPAFLKFNHPALQAKFAEILAADFVIGADGKLLMPTCLEGAQVTIGGSTYSMGIGGLHSTEKSVCYIADSSTKYLDRDVNSFYPSLILKCGLFPKNMGEHFQRIYKDFFDRRIHAKKNGHSSVAQTLKIFLNGSFGKLGSKYSVLYAPDLLLQVTVTGQLVLLMLIERYEAAGIPVVSANTDGVVAACPVSLTQTMLDIVSQWEQDTGMETEETRYRGLFSRDVNNYVALKEKGGYKTKGTLASPGVQKNPANSIVSTAVCEFLDKGMPIAETIYRCRDLRQFLRVQRVTGGARAPKNTIHVDHWVQQGEHWTLEWQGKTYKEKRKSKPHPILVTNESEYLGKVVRWYVSTKGYSHLEYATNANRVPQSEGAMPCMTLPDEFPADLDHAYYIKEANDLLREVGYARI